MYVLDGGENDKSGSRRSLGYVVKCRHLISSGENSTSLISVGDSDMAVAGFAGVSFSLKMPDNKKLSGNEFKSSGFMLAVNLAILSDN